MATENKLKDITPEEIASSFVLPHGLSKTSKDKADIALNETLNKKRAAMSDKQRLEMQLLRFKFLLEDYIKSNDYDDRYTFGFFLRNYLAILNKKNKEFAYEIDVPQRSLSNWLNNHKIPSESIFIRLEIHSNNTIPAVNWFRAAEKGKEYFLINNSKLRASQKGHVKKKAEVSF